MDNLEYFNEEIMGLAKEHADEILKQLDQKIASSIKDYKDELSNQYHYLLTQHQSSLNSKAKRDIAAIDFATNEQLDALRKDIELDVFKQAKEKIITFQNSGDYVSKMQEKLSWIDQNFQLNSGKLMVSPTQVSCFERLASTCNIEIDDTLELGGFKFVNDQIEIDETYDTLLQQQKEWFYLNSGLYIK